jgi:hypothetical protein
VGNPKLIPNVRRTAGSAVARCGPSGWLRSYVRGGGGAPPVVARRSCPHYGQTVAPSVTRDVADGKGLPFARVTTAAALASRARHGSADGPGRRGSCAPQTGRTRNGCCPGEEMRHHACC